jgi:guanylate kinase
VKPFLLVLSAPSGGGKTTVTKALLKARKDLGYSISATTRAPRAGERDGQDYYFVTREEFLRRREAGDFIESAEYSGNLYGTLRSEVERILGTGHHAVLDIEIRGARQIRTKYSGETVSIFIMPPSAEVLLERLGGRGTDRPSDLKRRLFRAVDEVREAPEYDYVVVNVDKAKAMADVAAIIDAESHRVRRTDELKQQVDDLARGLEQAAAQLPQP